jgi:hypothetical protein
MNLNLGGFVGALIGIGLLIGALVLTGGEHLRAIVKIGIFGVILMAGGGNWLWGALTAKPSDVNPHAPPPPNA